MFYIFPVGCHVSLTWPGCSPASPCLPSRWGFSWPGCLHGRQDGGSSLCLPASPGVQSAQTRPWHTAEQRQSRVRGGHPHVADRLSGTDRKQKKTFTVELFFRTHLTASPASRRALAVPPEATRDRPTSTSLLAKSTSPVLSDTLKSAAGTRAEET